MTKRGCVTWGVWCRKHNSDGGTKFRYGLKTIDLLRMNGISRLTVGLLTILLVGCVDQVKQPKRPSDERSAGSRRKVAAVSLEQLRGVHPEQPLILKTDAYDFRSSSDGRTVFCGNREGVGVWSMATGNRSRMIKLPELVLGLALNSTDDAMLTVSTGKATPARLWDLKTGNMLREFPSPYESALESSQVSTEDHSANVRQQPEIWKFPRDSIVPEAGFGFTCAAFDAADAKVATGGEDGRIIIWNATTVEPIHTLATGIPRILSIAFSADGSRLLVAAKDDRIQLWDLDNPKILRQFDETRRDNWVEGYRPAIAFCADGSKFALYSPRALEILICDATSGDVLHRISEPSRVKGGLQVSLRRGLGFIDESTLFSNTAGLIQIRNFKTGELLQHQECKSGVNSGYAYPSIEYVEFLPALDAIVAVEVENDENTGHDSWTTISFRPRKLIESKP